jgi:hypothetical protein
VVEASDDEARAIWEIVCSKRWKDLAEQANVMNNTVKAKRRIQHREQPGLEKEKARPAVEATGLSTLKLPNQG